VGDCQVFDESVTSMRAVSIRLTGGASLVVLGQFPASSSCVMAVVDATKSRVASRRVASR